MTDMLKKNNFVWSKNLKAAFYLLKEVVAQAPVLALLDFSARFVIECDSSGLTIGVVLMQRGRPLAFFIQTLKSRTKEMSTYEKELYAIVTAMQKWRLYLLG